MLASCFSTFSKPLWPSCSGLELQGHNNLLHLNFRFYYFFPSSLMTQIINKNLANRCCACTCWIPSINVNIICSSNICCCYFSVLRVLIKFSRCVLNTKDFSIFFEIETGGDWMQEIHVLAVRLKAIDSFIWLIGLQTTSVWLTVQQLWKFPTVTTIRKIQDGMQFEIVIYLPFSVGLPRKLQNIFISFLQIGFHLFRLSACGLYCHKFVIFPRNSDPFLVMGLCKVLLKIYTRISGFVYFYWVSKKTWDARIT